MISFDRDVLGRYETAIKKEWLVTNGIGGYASSTVIGCNTRRYHGLLIAAMKPPVARTVLVSKLEEIVKRDGEYFFLSTNKYPNTLSPKGFVHAESFSLEPFPKTVFRADGLSIEKEVFMVYGENTTVVTYSLKSDEEVTFSLSPLVVCRDFHWEMREASSFFNNVDNKNGHIVMKPFEHMPEVHIRADGMEYKDFKIWYKDMEHEEEQNRGLGFQEDLFNPGKFSISFIGEKKISVILSDKDISGYDADKLRAKELKRQKLFLKTAGCKDDMDKALVLAADKFIVRKKGNLRTIIAGYHWFCDWGRDTMISLPGLTLTTKRYDDAKKTLMAFGHSMNKGLIPNLFTDFKGIPCYNTMDASLWFIYAGYLYYKETADDEFLAEKLLPWFEKIYKNYVKGTLFGIKVDSDGLVRGGDEDSQLTWMDVKVGKHVVTKRYGKPVEVNALWYNALNILHELTDDKKKKAEYAAMIMKVKSSFNEKFWNEKKKCLYDVVHSDSNKDASIRPNQIFAVSLKFSVLDKEKERAVFEKVKKELYTPLGLRTLSKKSPHYKGRYEGNQMTRDHAYHQGTAWGWLIGPYIDAYLKVNGDDEAAIKEAGTLLAPFYAQLRDHGIGGISEIFDGDPPHMPRGCINQAWSVAEVLRLRMKLKGK